MVIALPPPQPASRSADLSNPDSVWQEAKVAARSIFEALHDYRRRNKGRLDNLSSGTVTLSGLIDDLELRDSLTRLRHFEPHDFAVWIESTSDRFQIVVAPNPSRTNAWVQGRYTLFDNGFEAGP